jgi:hypothetical protein
MTTGDLHRKSLRSRTLNDFVEDVFLKLYDTDERFRGYLEAVGNEDAIEGLMIADDLLAAQMIREGAPEGSPVHTKNLAAIRRALGVVLRRYEISRGERANRIGADDYQMAIGE